MKQVESFEEAAKLRGYPTEKNFGWMPEKHRKAFESLYEYVIIQEAVAEGKEPDYGNDNEKFEPYADMGGSSGSRFSLYVHGYWRSYSYVGVRLASEDRKVVRYMIDKFGHLLKNWMHYVK